MNSLQSDKNVIFGAGEMGRLAYESLRAKLNICAFIDNDKNKHTSHIDGLPIKSPHELSNINPTKIIIASEYFEQIKQQLLVELAIDENQISVFKPVDSVAQFGLNSSKKALAENLLLDVCRELEAHQINYYVDAGTLLGIIRDDALIPWDDDLDIAVCSSHIEKCKLAIEQAIDKIYKKWDVELELDAYYAEHDFKNINIGDLRSFKLKPKNNKSCAPSLDVFIKYQKSDEMNYLMSSRAITMPAYHILNTQIKEFRGQNIRIPDNVDAYLTKHYGDWKTPNKEWNITMLSNSTVFKT